MHTEKFWNDEPSQSLVPKEGVSVFGKIQGESITRHRSDLTSRAPHGDLRKPYLVPQSGRRSRRRERSFPWSRTCFRVLHHQPGAVYPFSPSDRFSEG